MQITDPIADILTRIRNAGAARHATVEVPAPNKIVIHGIDKQTVGQFAAEVREKRPPEPYKGKGRYAGEFVRRKEGKTGAKKK